MVNPLENWSDQQVWVQRLQADSVERDVAITELRRYLVRGLSRALTCRYGGQIDVEDVAQQALLKILDSLDSFRSQCRFTTWATAIAVRIGISQLRRHYYRNISLDTGPHGDTVILEVSDSTAGDAADHVGRQSLIELLQRLIDHDLTDRQRLAIRGTLEGLPIEEIAARLQSNRNAVYKLVHDARLRLRQGFEARGVSAEDILTIQT